MPETEPRTWVCDGCMARVQASEVADFADFEHVLCRRCVERDRAHRVQRRVH